MRANVMFLIFIGVYVHKYIGHEIVNWWVGWTSIGGLSEVWVGGRRDADCGSG